MDDDVGVGSFMERIARRSVPADHLPTIRVATSPAEALAFLDAMPSGSEPIAVISDYNMGTSATGLDLLKEVGRRCPLSRRVLMSGYPREDFDGQLPEDVLDDFLPKPPETARLKAMFQRLIEGDPLAT